jgi:hypothetical protein
MNLMLHLCFSQIILYVTGSVAIRWILYIKEENDLKQNKKMKHTE